MELALAVARTHHETVNLICCQQSKPRFQDLSVWKSGLSIYHSSRVSIGKVKRVFCFSIVRDNQAKGISTAGTLHGQVRGNSSGKRSFVEFPRMEPRIIAHSVLICYCITPVNLWRRRVDE